MGLSLKNDLDLQWDWPRIKGARVQMHNKKMFSFFLTKHVRMPTQFFLIDENDVTAGHAASIGQVDPEDMYS